MTENESKSRDEKQTLAQVFSLLPKDYKFEQSSTKEANVIANIHHVLYGRFPHDYEYGVESKVDQILSLVYEGNLTSGHLMQEIINVIETDFRTTAQQKLDTIKAEAEAGLRDNYNCSQNVLDIIRDGFTKEQEEEMLKGYELQDDPQQIPGERHL